MHRALLAMENERMKTHLLIEIDHSKALPDDVTDDVANRVYTMLHARGIACDVTVTNQSGPLKIRRDEHGRIESLCRE